MLKNCLTAGSLSENWLKMYYKIQLFLVTNQLLSWIKSLTLGLRFSMEGKCEMNERLSSHFENVFPAFVQIRPILNIIQVKITCQYHHFTCSVKGKLLRDMHYQCKSPVISWMNHLGKPMNGDGLDILLAASLSAWIDEYTWKLVKFSFGKEIVCKLSFKL